MIKRDDTYGLVYRKTVKDSTIMTVFGKREVVVKTCSCCKKTLPLSCFYLEAKTKRKNDNQTRSQCVSCWDKYKGATGKKAESFFAKLELVY